MQTSSDNQSGPAAALRENDRENWAGWHKARPQTIPAPTYWPFVLSLGATLMGLGILTSRIISVTGTILFILAIIKWIGELIRED